MVTRPDAQTMKLISGQLNFISKKYHPEKIILFGSRARGDHLKESDIDLLIISKAFQGMDWRERIIGAFGRWDKRQMLEPICLTPDEFKERRQQLGIVRQAVKEGIKLT